MLRLRENQHVLQVSGLVLGLGLYSYHMRELMVCWFFFSLLFVLLALLILVGALACYAGRCVIDWTSTSQRVTPVVTLSIDGVRTENNLG